MLDDFETTQHITASIELDLAGFEGDLLGDFILINRESERYGARTLLCSRTYHVSDESVAVSEHGASASGHGDLLPL